MTQEAPFPLTLPDRGFNLFASTRRYQDHFIRLALDRAEGNKTRAAAMLGINRTTLLEILRRRKTLSATHNEGKPR